MMQRTRSFLDIDDTGRSTTSWTIENLSCWNVEVHGKVIENPHSSFPSSTKIQLYPKGLSGQDELMIRVTPMYSEGYECFVMIRDSKGEVVYRENMGFWFSKETYERKIKPFDEVVSTSWKIVSSEQDRINVDCVIIAKNIDNHVNCMRTKVEIFDVSLKIPNKIMKECEFPVYTSTIEYPRNEDSMNSMSVYLSTDNSNMCIELEPDNFEKNILVYAYMSVVAANRALEKKEQRRHLFKDGNKWVFKSSIAREDLKSKGVALIIRVKIIPSNKYQYDTLFSGIQNRGVTVQVFPKVCYDRHASGAGISENPVSLSQPGNSMDVLTRDFTCLYLDHHFSDFKLRCGDVIFPVHKNILSARSLVFKTMLSSDMRETDTGEVQITDIDPSTVDLFLSYLYAGVTDDLQWESALKLYYAADKYQVLSLKAKCASFLATGVCIDNVCDLLSWAEKHQNETLSTMAQNFIVNNYRETLCSEKWKSFMESEPLIAVKTLTNFAEKNFVKGDIRPVLPKD